MRRWSVKGTKLWITVELFKISICIHTFSFNYDTHTIFLHILRTHCSCSVDAEVCVNNLHLKPHTHKPLADTQKSVFLFPLTVYQLHTSAAVTFCLYEFNSFHNSFLFL